MVDMFGGHDIEDWFTRERNRIVASAIDRREAPSIAKDLISLYSSVPVEQRSTADALLVTWIQGSDEEMRFEALDLVRHFGIESALPALRTWAQFLETSNEPGAAQKWAHVNLTIAKVEARE